MIPPDTAFHYEGYRTTPPLWREGVLTAYPQIELPEGPKRFPPDRDPPRRLGKRVESFVYHQLRHAPGIEWITDSLQIQQNNRTVGELDALYYDHGTPVHLEVAYKFYLCDTLNEQTDPLARWIGPNRKDNLSLKLQKMAGRQFPLLYHPAADPYLRAHGLSAGAIQQRLCFKGLLFVPHDQTGTDPGPLNANCVAGFHLPFAQLSKLNKSLLFVPRKPDWLTVPHHDVPWLSFDEARNVIHGEVQTGRSPMVWWRAQNGRTGRCFVTAW